MERPRCRPAPVPGARCPVSIPVLLLMAAVLQAAAMPEDAAALLAFKASLDNGDELLRSWQAGSDPCSWKYINCDADGWVTRMVLSDVGLRGTMPQPDGWDLPARLEALEAADNRLSGPIPPAWKLPSGCQQMNLKGNPLGGSISAAWALPDSLIRLILEQCNLTGALPASWQLPPAIQLVNLSQNRLSGTIPPSLAALQSLHFMHLTGNLLTGPLPASFALDTSTSLELRGLSVSNNNLSGPIPSWPNLPDALLYVQPGNEGLCGSVPNAPKVLAYAWGSQPQLIATVEELPPCPGDPPARGGALSAGAIAGMVVGAAAAAALLLAGAVVLVWRRKQSRGAALLQLASGNGGFTTGTARVSLELSSLGSSPLQSGTSKSPSRLHRSADGGIVSTGSTRSLADALPRLLADNGRDARQDSASGTPANMRWLQQQLAQLELEPPPWLVMPTRLLLWQCVDGGMDLLGRGTFGRVYRGLLQPGPHQPHDDAGASRGQGDAAGGPAGEAGLIPVAIKVLEMVDLRALIKEAGLMWRLSGNAHVVRLYGACIVEQQAMVVMELMEGGDLRAAIDADAAGVLSWCHLGKQIALDIASGLAYLHSNNVTHRDLKSRNVLLDADLRAKVADIGSAALHSATYMSAGSSNFRGTLAWAAPELLLARPCSQKIDIYSLGVVLWEIVVREVPRRGVVCVPHPSANCPQGLADLIADCLKVDPDARPTAQQALDRLQLL